MTMWARKKLVDSGVAPDASLITARFQAEQELVAAHKQAQEAEEVVKHLTRTRLRNGFAPAIEASIRRKLGGQT